MRPSPREGLFVTTILPGRSKFLLSVCIPFILLLQFSPDTIRVIPNMLRKAPIATGGGPDALVDFSSPILATSLPEASIAPWIRAEVGRYRVRLAQSVE